MNSKEVGARIKKLREDKRMTKNALANYSGVSPTYIYQLEEGQKSPTIEYLGHICWGLGITLSDFFAVEEPILEDKINNLSSKQKQLLNEFLNSL